MLDLALAFHNELPPEAKATFLDQEKAYDRIEWSYLNRVLDKFGVKSKLRTWISWLLQQSKLRIRLEDTMGDLISTKRSIPQGNPVSPFLYILAIEPMLMLMRKKVSGISLGGTNFVTNAFVDDIMVFTANHEDELRMQQILTTYTKASGAKFNEEKSHRFVFHKSPQLNKLKFKYLGFFLNEQGWDTNELETSLLQNFRTRITEWKRHFRSITAKALLVNTFLYSKLWYHARITTYSKEFISKIRKTVREFIWHPRSTGIPLDVLETPRKYGGLGILPLENQLLALQTTWWHDLAKTKPPKWAPAAQFLLDREIQKETGFMYIYLNINWKRYKQISKPWIREKVRQLHRLPISINTKELLESPFFWDLPPMFLYPISNMSIKAYMNLWKNLKIANTNTLLQRLNQPEVQRKFSRLIARHQIEEMSRSSFKMPEKGVGNASPILSYISIDNTLIHECTLKILRQATVKNYTMASRVWPTSSLGYEPLWAKIYSTVLPASFASFLWKVHSGVFRTSKQLAKWIEEVDNRCSRCGAVEENLHHRYWECRTSHIIWTRVALALDKENSMDHTAILGLHQWTGFESLDLIIYTAILWTIHRTHYLTVFDQAQQNLEWEPIFLQTLDQLVTLNRELLTAEMR